ncbi:hypothetical protein [Aeromonas hydrophila]|uniref:hypothetical protein n=1 Tax=Aeromonas hydrophila TaxID=644 RepID=UPI0039880C7C
MTKEIDFGRFGMLSILSSIFICIYSLSGGYIAGELVFGGVKLIFQKADAIEWVAIVVCTLIAWVNLVSNFEGICSQWSMMISNLDVPKRIEHLMMSHVYSVVEKSINQRMFRTSLDNPYRCTKNISHKITKITPFSLSVSCRYSIDNNITKVNTMEGIFNLKDDVRSIVLVNASLIRGVLKDIVLVRQLSQQVMPTLIYVVAMLIFLGNKVW